MAAASVRADKVSAFVQHIADELRRSSAKGVDRPVERRKVRTITEECGYKKASQALLDRLTGEVERAGLYTLPGLGAPGLRPDDWVRFSTQPLAEHHAFFPSEKALCEFVKLGIQERVGIFRDLKLVPTGRNRGTEVGLPSGKRVDILCEERTRSGKGALVAIELSREKDRGVATQLIEYMDELRRLNNGREVKGMIIEGGEAGLLPSIIEPSQAKHVTWHVYDVSFREVPVGPTAQ